MITMGTVPFALFLLANVVIVVVLPILLHETGHLIVGWLTGHRLVYFCCLGFCKYGKYVKTALGTEGVFTGEFFKSQCVMYPKKFEDEKDFVERPLMFLAGGCIMNLLIAAVMVPAFIKYFKSTLAGRPGFEMGCACLLWIIANLYLVFHNWFGKDPTFDGNTFRMIRRDANQGPLYLQTSRISFLICAGYTYGRIYESSSFCFDTRGQSGTLAEEIELYEYYAQIQLAPNGERAKRLAERFRERLDKGSWFEPDLRCELGIASLIRHIEEPGSRVDDSVGIDTGSTPDREKLKKMLYHAVCGEGPVSKDEALNIIKKEAKGGRLVFKGQWMSAYKTYCKIFENRLIDEGEAEKAVAEKG